VLPAEGAEVDVAAIAAIAAIVAWSREALAAYKLRGGSSSSMSSASGRRAGSTGS
jgi:hypothetical protein